jgi:hypothetical protein
MGKSLDSAKAKVQWAEKHFSDFKDIVFGRSDGIDRRPTTVTHYSVPRQTYSGASQFALNRECRLAFGDAVHQLRASLDHVVYKLVEGLTTDPRAVRKIDFPLYSCEDLFNRSRGVKHLRELLPSDQFEEILSSQPYRRYPHAPESDWLWVLHELDNIDKHPTILVVDPRLMIKTRQADGLTQRACPLTSPSLPLRARQTWRSEQSWWFCRKRDCDATTSPRDKSGETWCRK